MTEEQSKLVEIIRQMESYVAWQLRAREELDDKVEQLLAIALGLLGGGIALLGAIGLVVGMPMGGAWTAALPAIAGIVTVGGSALLLLDAYVGLTERRGSRVHAGADPAWLSAVAGDTRWTLAHLQYATIKGLRNRSDENRADLAKAGKLRRRAVGLVLAGAGLYVAAIFMTLNGG